MEQLQYKLRYGYNDTNARLQRLLWQLPRCGQRHPELQRRCTWQLGQLDGVGDVQQQLRRGVVHTHTHMQRVLRQCMHARRHSHRHGQLHGGCAWQLGQLGRVGRVQYNVR